MASGRFQLACYKEEIEANLRTPGLGGFQLLDLHDYLGQGTALVGLLDAFWQSKSYVSAEEFKQFSKKIHDRGQKIRHRDRRLVENLAQHF